MNRKDKSNPNNMQIEQELRGKGYQLIACVDECGRGPFSGPVVAACVVMPPDIRIERLTDSKKIPKSEHLSFSKKVKEAAVAYGIGMASVEEIDQYNIKQATRLAMKRAVESMELTPDYLLVDGTEVVDLPYPQHSVIKGDDHSHGISAAAIIAKTFRDEWMKKLDEETGFVYNWTKNAGYATQHHLDACEEHGVTKHHRTSWKHFKLYKKNKSD